MLRTLLLRRCPSLIPSSRPADHSETENAPLAGNPCAGEGLEPSRSLAGTADFKLTPMARRAETDRVVPVPARQLSASGHSSEGRSERAGDCHVSMFRGHWNRCGMSGW